MIFTSPMKYEDSLFEYAKKIKLKITKIGNVGSTSKNPGLFDEKHMEFKASYYTFKHFK